MNKFKKLKSQAGITLLELMLVIGLGSLITLNEIQQEALESQQARTKQMANEIITFNNAVLAHISYFQGLITSTNIPAEVTGIKRGIDWLKRTGDCPTGTNTSGSEFLDCSFLNYNNGRIGYSELEFETFFDSSYDPTSERGKILALTVLSDYRSGTPQPWRLNGDIAYGLSGLAAVQVNQSNSFAGGSSGVNTTSEATFCITASTRSPQCDSPLYTNGNSPINKIVLLNSNASGEDIYLRIDGSNEMNADLRFEQSLPYNNREILNISRLIGNGTQGVVLGSGGTYGTNTPTSDLVVVNANEEIYGNLNVKANSLLEGELTVSGRTTINNNADINGRLQVRDDIISQRNITALGNISASNANITNTVTANTLVARRFQDRDNGSFFSDPSSTSSFNTIRANNINNQGSGTLNIITRGSASDVRIDADDDLVVDADDLILVRTSNDISLSATDRVDTRGRNIQRSATSSITDTGASYTNTTRSVNFSGVNEKGFRIGGRTLESYLPPWVAIGSYAVRNGSYVPSPSTGSHPLCRIGIYRIILSTNYIDLLSRNSSQPDRYPSRGSVRLIATRSGNGWSVTGNSAGNIQSGSSAAGVATTYCLNDAYF